MPARPQPTLRAETWLRRARNKEKAQGILSLGHGASRMGRGAILSYGCASRSSISRDADAEASESLAAISQAWYSPTLSNPICASAAVSDWLESGPPLLPLPL